MRNKKRKYILLIVIVILFIGVITIYNNYNNEIYIHEDNNLSNSGLSLMVETKAGSGEYTISTSDEWPTNGYEFNAEKSACENGGTLSWDEENQSVVMTSKSSDKCYAYFDIVPPDVTIAVNNLPTTYGKLGSINCTNSDAIYNEQYNRVEISQINKKYTTCDLNYTDSTSKVNFADYIMGLAGTTQGNGQVVNEEMPDYSTASVIAQSSYTSQSAFSSTSYSSTSGTTVSGKFKFANNAWSSVPSAMTSNTYYHFKFNPSESGYYKLCYNLSAGNINNELYLYVNNTQQKFGGYYTYLDASSTDSKEGCMELGYLTISDYVKVVQRTYTTISTLTFDVRKVNTITAPDFRYEGKNPNNYVWFNNEYWRIIGVFDSGSHGQDGKHLVKIIRDDSIGGLAWDKSSKNDWTLASLNSLLNGAYYNAQDGTSSGYCYGYGTTVTANCNYTKKGVQSNYRPMIANVIWYLGGILNTDSIVENYKTERGTTVYGENSATASGYIGLIYPSDFGYSALSSNCARTEALNYYSTLCAANNWLFGKGNIWTITQSLTYGSSIYLLNENGHINTITYNNTGVGVYPVLFLNNFVYLISGKGTLNEPYIIGM